MKPFLRKTLESEMTYSLKHRFAPTRLGNDKSAQAALTRFAVESLAEVLEAIDLEIACDQWVETHLARRGIPAPSSEQLEMGWLRLVEMLAISMAFEHPDFSRVMDFVDRHEAALFGGNHSPSLMPRPNAPTSSPTYMGKPIYHLVEGFTEQLVVINGPCSQQPRARESDGRMRDLKLFCRYRGPIWDGELDMLLRQEEWDLIEGLQSAGLIDPREGMFALATCDPKNAPRFRQIFTTSSVVGEKECSIRFREMLRCAAAPCTHTTMPESKRKGFVLEQLEVIGESRYASNMLAYDFYAIAGEIQAAQEAYGLDNQKLFQLTLRKISKASSDFYRHVAIAFFEVPAGNAMSDDFTMQDFSRYAIKAFLRAYKLDESRSSPDLSITKSIMLMVDEADFDIEGIDNKHLQLLYKQTGFRKLLAGMGAHDLLSSLEGDLGL